jgi:hypothetical protein
LLVPVLTPASTAPCASPVCSGPKVRLLSACLASGMYVCMEQLRFC